MESLIHLNQLVKLEPADVLKEQIWFSDYTKFKTSIIPRWDSQGLRFIGDLFNPISGNILSREEIKRQYRIAMTFLCYESLVRSLPYSVKNTIHTSFQRPNIPFKVQLFLNKTRSSKYCYSLFVNALRKKFEASDANIKQKWNRDIGLHIEGSLLHVKRATKSAYLIYLHYRIINRIVATNKYLHAIQKADSNMCTFCTRDVETVTHLFWQCPTTRTFINNIDTQLYSQYQVHFQHSIHTWFFPQETNELQTLLITLTKSVIYKARNAGERPELSHWLNLVRAEAQKEQLASMTNDKIESFNNKWKTLKYIV